MQQDVRKYFSIDSLYPRSLKYLTNYLHSLIRGRLWLKVIIGMVLGIVTGILIGPSVGWVNPAIVTVVVGYHSWPGGYGRFEAIA